MVLFGVLHGDNGLGFEKIELDTFEFKEENDEFSGEWVKLGCIDKGNGGLTIECFLLEELEKTDEDGKSYSLN